MTHKDFAIDLAKKAGGIIAKNFFVGMKKSWKKDHSPVTATDIAINKMVIEKIKKKFPTHSIIGEESSHLIAGSEYAWVCDPVDGTVPFSHGIPTCVFSLALVRNGKPILGVVYDVMLDRLFFAQRGKGAFLNGKRIKVNSSGLKNSVAFWPTRTGSRLKSKYPKVFILCLYSICYEGVMVANGGAIATFYDSHYPHDIAALKIIVEEAGGKVTDKNGKEQRYDRNINGALVSNGLVHKELLKFTRKIKAR